MKVTKYSFIIPVFNRPEEVSELLESISKLKGNFSFEIVIVEDGSTVDSKSVIEELSEDLNISYYFKPNSGPGDSRNFGMNKAQGDYFIILDSDCLLPPEYLIEVDAALTSEYVHCFGGPDAAHQSFSNLQKAINFAMTSFITTGGIRGSKANQKGFQPRSFNMGLSKKAFEATGGFGNIHPGEDPDLSIRLNKQGFKTTLFPNAFVYHKRRISWNKFYQQVSKFGLVRPILNKWHPETQRLIYWLPTCFVLGLVFSIVLSVFNYHIPILLYVLYFTLAFVISLWNTKSIIVSILSLFAIFVQFAGYGIAFLRSTVIINWLNRKPEQVYPKLFFNEN